MASGGAPAVPRTTERALQTLSDDESRVEEKRRGMASGGAQAVASATEQALLTIDDDGSPIEEKRRKTESGGAQAVVYGADGRPIDGVSRATLFPNCKHGDGSINRVDYWTKVYRLEDTNETCLEPMMMSEPLTSCSPKWRNCEKHASCTMMQICSLKLPYTYSSVGGPVQLYGYLAVRDLRNPLRNYIFKRTRDDPFLVEKVDAFIQMTGPKRGIRIHAPVLIEFDMKIKRGEGRDDLQLVDGVAVVNDITTVNAFEHTQRIDGYCGAVDITLACMQCCVEATVQVGILERADGCSLSLNLIATYISSRVLLREPIQLFDGVIAPETNELKRSVVAVPWKVQLALILKLKQTGSNCPPICRYYICRSQKHGDQISILKFGFATVEVKVTWSTLDIPTSLLGPNCYMYECDAADDVGNYMIS